MLYYVTSVWNIICKRYYCNIIWFDAILMAQMGNLHSICMIPTCSLSFKKLFHPSLATYCNPWCYENPENWKNILSRRVHCLVDYLATNLGNQFNKKNFLKSIFDQSILRIKYGKQVRYQKSAGSISANPKIHQI